MTDTDTDTDPDIKTIEFQMPHLRPSKQGAQGLRRIEKNESGIRKVCSNWQADDAELTIEEQIAILKDGWVTGERHSTLMRQQIATKITGYRAQDIEKDMYDADAFITIDAIRNELIKCDCKCYYCNEGVKILYTAVRDRRQWTVDRIYNNRGHNCNNLVIACLGCNLHRRCRNAEEFNTTSNMIVVKEGHSGPDSSKAHLGHY